MPIAGDPIGGTLAGGGLVAATATTVTRTGLDLIVDALSEIRVARAGDALEPDALDLALRRLNALLDQWNADGRAAFDTSWLDGTLTPNLSPHTIGAVGSGASFETAFRPVELLAAQLNVGGTPAAYLPITPRGDAWYQAQTVPGISVTVPTDVYYGPGWPEGSLYFFGVPSVAYGVRLWMRVALASISDPTADFSLPPGYYKALYLSLAEDCARPFGQQKSADLAFDASVARALIFGNNDDDRALDTADSGLSRGGGVGFNWLSRDTV